MLCRLSFAIFPIKYWPLNLKSEDLKPAFNYGYDIWDWQIRQIALFQAFHHFGHLYVVDGYDGILDEVIDWS